MFVWSAFLGVPFCLKHGLSIKVDQFRNMFPVKLQKALIYIDKIVIFNTIYYIIYLFNFCCKSKLYKWTSKSSYANTYLVGTTFGYSGFFYV